MAYETTEFVDSRTYTSDKWQIVFLRGIIVDCETGKEERFFWSSYPSLAMVYDERLIYRENAEEKRAPKMKKGKLSVAKGSGKEIERIFFEARFAEPKLRTVHK